VSGWPMPYVAGGPHRVVIAAVISTSSRRGFISTLIMAAKDRQPDAVRSARVELRLTKCGFAIATERECQSGFVASRWLPERHCIMLRTGVESHPPQGTGFGSCTRPGLPISFISPSGSLR
jgi:hypothetical protein